MFQKKNNYIRRSNRSAIRIPFARTLIFGEYFLSNGTGIFFFALKTGMGLSCYHLQNTGIFFVFSRHDAWRLVIQENGTENYGCSGKKEIPRKELPFFPKSFHRDQPLHLNSLWIGITGFSIQMASASSRSLCEERFHVVIISYGNMGRDIILTERGHE